MTERGSAQRLALSMTTSVTRLSASLFVTRENFLVNQRAFISYRRIWTQSNRAAPFIKVHEPIKHLLLLLWLLRKSLLLLRRKSCHHTGNKPTSQTPQCHHHLFMFVSPMLCRTGLTKNKMAASMLLLACHQEHIS